MGSAAGAHKVAAARIGVPIEQYVARREGGLRWCNGCRAWHPRSEFGTDASRHDGVRRRCRRAEYEPNRRRRAA